MNSYIEYHRTQLDSIRKEINFFRRQERAILKDIRKHCVHRDVKRIAIRQPMMLSTSQFNGTSAVSDTYYRYKVVCNDCGKVLQK